MSSAKEEEENDKRSANNQNKQSSANFNLNMDTDHSDFDYALSLHFMLNGESAIDNIMPNIPNKSSNSDDSIEEGEIVEEIVEVNIKILLFGQKSSEF